MEDVMSSSKCGRENKFTREELSILLKTLREADQSPETELRFKICDLIEESKTQVSATEIIHILVNILVSHIWRCETSPLHGELAVKLIGEHLIDHYKELTKFGNALL